MDIIQNVPQSPSLNYKNGSLYVEDVSVTTLAKEHGTPLYVYSKKHIVDAYTSFKNAFGTFPIHICYAVKANSNLAILNLFVKLGACFDIVSQGEMVRVLKAGGEPGNIVFSGVGKTESEIRFALEQGVKCFNIESEAELYRIDKIAGQLNKKAPISFRVNPDIDAMTHKKISTGLKENKFGIAYERAIYMYKEAARCENVTIKGIDCHIGSQLTNSAPFTDALGKLIAIVDELNKENIQLEHIDIGGGLGILYNSEKPINLSVTDYASKLLERMSGRPEHLMFEPGRFLVGNSGVLLTSVEYLKHHEDKNFAIIDAAMNDLIRPTLYDAFHEIINVKHPEGKKGQVYDIVGPVCETGDYLAKDREIHVEEGDLLAVLSAGAYGMAMSSNYNTRLRPAEILVDGDSYDVVRERETYEDLIRGESIPFNNLRV